MILLIDNYDSFVHNLARYFQRLGHETLVFRNTRITPDGVRELAPEAIVLSPGPCTPRDAGCSLEIVRSFYRQVPILGICLGHQTIAEALGGRVVRASEAVHGRDSLVTHDGRGAFNGLRNPLRACRYHSLVVERSSIPKCLEVSAWLDDGTVMALRHCELPLVGFQFHPESILTEFGYNLLTGFLKRAGLSCVSPTPNARDELSSVHR